MNIKEAMLNAQLSGRGITRESWGTRSPLIIPTNTTECMIFIERDGVAVPRWQPIADDITADDWYVSG